MKKSILANKNDQKKLEVQLEKKIKVFNSNKQILEFEKIKLANEAKLISLLKEKEEHDKLLGELEYLKSKISNLEDLIDSSRDNVIFRQSSHRSITPQMTVSRFIIALAALAAAAVVKVEVKEAAKASAGEVESK